MLSVFKKQSIVVFFIFSMASADFGDLPIGWSQLKSDDFQDFAVRSLNREGALLNHYTTHFWLEQKIIELNLASESPVQSVIPAVLRDRSINAFAIPGNLIGFNAGLIAFAESESEFVSVLAHEMAHISLDHFSRLTNNQSQQSLTIITGILLAILLAQENPEAANAAIFSTFAAASQNSLNFSQAMELEADQVAQSTLRRSGYDAEAGRLFFQKLEQTSFSNSAYEFLRSHPLGATRSAMLNSENSIETEQPEITDYDVLRWELGLDDREKVITIFKDWQSLPSDITSPTIKLGWLKWNFQQNKDRESYLQALSDLNTIHSGFLPIEFALLQVVSDTKLSSFCANLNTFESKITAKLVTLDVLEFMNDQASVCNLNSRQEWQAKWLWQSGKELQSMSFLKSEIAQEAELNRLARMKSLLKLYNQRYDRFR